MEESLVDFVRTQDPDRFLCALFAPVAQRPALFTLIAYNHELARAREAASTPMLALIRLQWWRDAVAEAASGAPPRRHEVAGPLHAAIVAGTLDPAALTAMADAREPETAEEGIPSREAFASYLRGSAGGLALAAGRLLGAPPALLPALQAAGVPAGVCQTAEDRCETDPQLRHGNWLVELEQPTIGRWPAKEVPVTFSETPPCVGGFYHRMGPDYGQDTRDVLRDLLGMDEARIAELAEAGVV